MASLAALRSDDIAESEMLMFNDYNRYGTMVPTAQPDIVNTLQLLSDIEPEVISKAIEIYYRCINSRMNESGHTRSVKGSRKSRFIFFCVFMAYNEVGHPVDPNYAADLVNLSYDEIEKALKEYASSGITLIDPELLVKFYVARINDMLTVKYDSDILEEGVKHVIQTCKANPAGLEWTQNTAAKIIAISSLYFYINDIKGMDISSQITIFEKACYLSWACIRRYHEQVAKYYNSDTREVRKGRVKITYI